MAVRIDERHLDVGAAQLARRGQPAEAATDDYDPPAPAAATDRTSRTRGLVSPAARGRVGAHRIQVRRHRTARYCQRSSERETRGADDGD